MAEADASRETATLTIQGKTLELPIIVGSEGEMAIDIRKLRAATGAITYDPGYGNTGSCLSEITYLDGEKGILRYCGYPIEELAEKSTFLEVAWLLMRGELPTAKELASFRTDITYHTMLHEDLKRFYSAMPKAGHPMAVSAAAVGALSTFYQDVKYDDPAEKRWASAIRLLAKVPTIAAYAYKHSLGQPAMYPRNELLYCENILHMMFSNPCEEYKPDPVAARALDLLLILHADHEQNCSTSTVRMVGSAQSNLFASVSAGISALWGPLHGGANQKVIEMLISIHAGDRTAKEFMELAKDKESGVRLMGFGHRVYKNYDPRARILKGACHELLAKVGTKNRCSRSRSSSRRSRSRTATSSSASSTRTSTSTPASSTRLWGSRSTCSPCSSRWVGCRAGSRSGSSSTRTRTPGSVARARSSPARRSAATCRSTSGSRD